MRCFRKCRFYYSLFYIALTNKLVVMELIISPSLMNALIDSSIDNANTKDYSFVDERSQKMKDCISIMENMGVRSIELDLSADDDSLLDGYSLDDLCSF
jgi:hypothetical protein